MAVAYALILINDMFVCELRSMAITVFLCLPHARLCRVLTIDIFERKVEDGKN